MKTLFFLLLLMFHRNKSNPFQYYDPRTMRCYKDIIVPHGVVIPTTDDAAWEHFSRHRWVYSKIEVALTQGLACGPMGVIPTQFPVFMKPITNLHGAGVGSRLIQTLEEYKQQEHFSGYFWMENLVGEHLSHDFVMIDGKPVFLLTFLGHSLGQGIFDYWEIREASAPLKEYLTSWMAMHLQNFTGCLNIETIGGKIIEVHLRMGDIDRVGNPLLMQSIVDVYAGEKWNFHSSLPPLYLFALWGEWNTNYSISKEKAAEICQSLPFYQIDDPALYFQNPPGGVRIALVGSTSFEKGVKARQLLYENFSPRPRAPRLVR